MTSSLIKSLSWIITLITPLLLTGLALRLLLTPLFLQIEYRMPYFPADEYGFSRSDRLHWSRIALDYLLMNPEKGNLADLNFSDGSPLYSTREVQHMVDVRSIVQQALQIWYFTITLAAVLAVWSWQSGWLGEFIKGSQRGGWLMIGLATFIGLIAALGIGLNPEIFWKFFTAFHQMFFEGNSWLFAYSDTLIRLFPIRFWQDAFLFAAVISCSSGLILALGIKMRS